MICMAVLPYIFYLTGQKKKQSKVPFNKLLSVGIPDGFSVEVLPQACRAGGLLHHNCLFFVAYSTSKYFSIAFQFNLSSSVCS